MPVNTAKRVNNNIMSVDIRQYTRVIIRKNRQYLQRKALFSNEIIWDNSPYTAWYTRDAAEAKKVALKTGGIAMLFNPIIGKTKVL